MKLKAGDQVLIDLEIVETHVAARRSRCCGRGYDPADLHRLLRYLAEGEWRVSGLQGGRVGCAYCKGSVPMHRGEIILESAFPLLVGRQECQRWVARRSWLRLAAGGAE